jgi:hypothetical protein
MNANQATASRSSISTGTSPPQKRKSADEKAINDKPSQKKSKGNGMDESDSRTVVMSQERAKRSFQKKMCHFASTLSA